MNTNVYVTGKFKVKKEKLSESIALMKSLTITSQTESGCIAYFYLQNIADECEFTSYEVWENEADESKHWTTDHVQKALNELPNLLETSPEITKWSALS